jgi:hypothetical protein
MRNAGSALSASRVSNLLRELSGGAAAPCAAPWRRPAARTDGAKPCRWGELSCLMKRRSRGWGPESRALEGARWPDGCEIDDVPAADDPAAAAAAAA